MQFIYTNLHWFHTCLTNCSMFQYPSWLITLASVGTSLSTASHCSAVSFSLPNVSQRNSLTWIALPWPFLCKGCSDSGHQPDLRPSFAWKRLSSCVTKICRLSPEESSGWMQTSMSSPSKNGMSLSYLIIKNNNLFNIKWSQNIWPKSINFIANSYSFILLKNSVRYSTTSSLSCPST